MALQTLVSYKFSYESSSSYYYYVDEVQPFGFDGKHCSTLLLEPAAMNQCTRRNVAKIAAMIPVIGALIGILRIVTAARCEESKTSFKAQHITRGVIETLGLGSLLLIPDLILTISRWASLRRAQIV